MGNRVAQMQIVIHKSIRLLPIALLLMAIGCGKRSTGIEIRGAIALSEFRLLSKSECEALDESPIKTNATITIKGDRGQLVGSSILEPGRFDYLGGQCIFRFMAIVPDQDSYLFELPNGWAMNGSAIGVNRIGF
jgi:hypothetical protein